MSFLEALLAAHQACDYERPTARLPRWSEARLARAEQLLAHPVSTDIAGFAPDDVVLLCQAGARTGRAEFGKRADAMLDAFFALPNWRYPHHQHMDQVELGMATLSARLAEASVGVRTLAPDLTHRVAEQVIVRGLEPFYAQATDPERPGWVRTYMNWRGYISGDMGRGAFLLQESYPRWRDCVAEAIKGAVAVADVGGEDGDWEEGIGYWGMCFGQVSVLAQQLLTASRGRVDLFAHPYFRAAGDFGLYCWMPGRKTVYAFSDWRVAAPRRDLMLYLASHERNPHYQWCADHNPEEPVGLPVEKTVTAAAPDALPPSKHFRGIDVAVLRSGWGREDIAVGFKCGPRRVQFHQHLDANSFVLYAGESPLIDELECTEEDARALYAQLALEGEPIARDARWGSAATLAHSTLLLGGAGQLVGETEWGPHIPGVREKTDAWQHGEPIPRAIGARIEGFGHRPGLSFAVGEAALAYPPPVVSFQRAVALVGSDTVLVADRLLTDTDLPVQALLHVPGRAERLSADSAEITNGRGHARLCVASAGSVAAAPAVQVLPWQLASGEERHVITVVYAARPPFSWAVTCFHLGRRAGRVAISDCERDRVVVSLAPQGPSVEVVPGARPRVAVSR